LAIAMSFCSMLLTFPDLSNMLHTAYRYSTRKYGHIPRLIDMLRFKFELAMHDMGNSDREPLELLHSYLHSERAVMNAWNKHRLGTAPSRLRHPMEAAARGKVLYDPSDNLVELLDTFPLRHETVRRGWPLPSSGIAPIYQEHAELPYTYTIIATPRKTTHYDKLADAPPSTLPFPTANLTLVELLTFLPQSLKTWPVIDRLITAGATTSLLTRIINEHRHMPHGAISNNSVYRMMRGSMDKRGKIDARYANWSVKKHTSVVPPTAFEPASISVAGFEAPGRDDGAVMCIRLRDLAQGVSVMPQGDDALDLTRCVAYALRYSAEDWTYPDDMTFVLGLLEEAGPWAVREENWDRSAIARFSGVDAKRKRRAEGEEDGDGDVAESGMLGMRRKRKRRDSDSDQKSSTTTPFPRRPPRSAPLPLMSASASASRPSRAASYANSADSNNSDSDSDVYRSLKRMKRADAPPRTSGRTKRVVGSYSTDETFW
jgi:hypothetical protein